MFYNLILNLKLFFKVFEVEKFNFYVIFCHMTSLLIFLTKKFNKV